ncbi:MAG: hypothetical protein LUE27_06665 [Clostridia bacterium]|nr:hypothetical protein [Clostridia bacterium]
MADLLMMSPYGYIVAISASSFETGCTFAKTYKDCEDYASALKSMSYRELDDIALDYTYNRTSKGCTIVGAMGDAGYLNYEDEALLIRQTELNLRRSRFLYIAIVQDADIEKDFCLEDEQFGVGFLCVKTYGTESPFAVASLKIIESE